MALSGVQPRTYLQLVQDLFRECGCAGIAPATTVGQIGEAARLVNYVHDAELEIQNLWVDWKWLRKTLTAYTVGGVAAPNGTYNSIVTTQGGGISAFPSDLAEWDYATFQILPIGSTYYQDLVVQEWQEVRREIFDTVDQSQPWRAIIMPDNSIRWDLTPDQSYQVYMEYRAVPYDFKNDNDVSNIPARFANRLIVEWARGKYGLFENAPEQIAASNNMVYGELDKQGIKQNQGLLAQLENDQLPNAKNSRLQQGNNIVVQAGHDDWNDSPRYRYW